MQRILIVLIAVTAGLLTYFAVAPLIDNAGEDRVPAQETEEAAQTTTDTHDQTAATTTEPETENTPVTAEEAELANKDAYPIRGTDAHPASGRVRVVQTPGEQIIRFEEYEGTDGPELRIYLANDLDATDPVDLGPSRSRSGNINYGVPIDVDIDAYTYVLTWSEAENELYDFAQIN